MASFDSFVQDPAKMAMLMGGVNMMAAAQGGRRDLSQQGLGYGLQQGLQGAARGYKMGDSFNKNAEQQARKAKLMGLLDDSSQPVQPQQGGLLSTNPMQSPVMSNPMQSPVSPQAQPQQVPAQMQNMFSNLSPMEKQIAGNMIQSGDTQGVYKLLADKQEQANVAGMRVGDFEDSGAQDVAIQRLSTGYNKQVAPHEQAIDYYNQSANLAKQSGGTDKMTGTDDFILLRNFIKQSLPAESVMSDDQITAKLAAGGYPGQIQQFWAQLTGEGQQGVEARKQILSTMENVAKTRVQYRNKVKAMYSNRSKQMKIEPDMFMLPFDPLTDWRTSQSGSAKPVVNTNSTPVMMGGKPYLKVGNDWVEQ